MMKAKSRNARVTKKTIAAMVRCIVRRFHPEKVILFGSCARGDAGSDSDVDLMVVMPVSGSKLDKIVEIRGILDSFRVPKDVIVVTPDEFDDYADIIGTIVRPAVKEGKLLYARS